MRKGKFINRGRSAHEVRIAIFHDTFTTVGGCEKLIVSLARALGADIITAQANPEVVRFLETKGITIISLGPCVHDAFLRTYATVKRFRECNVQKKYDLFIFSGIHSLSASQRHGPAVWYCSHVDKGLHYAAPSTFFGKCRRFVGAHVPISRWALRFLRFVVNSDRAALKELARYPQALKFSKSVVTDKADVARIERIVVNSEHTGEAVRRIFKRKSCVVHPGIDTRRYVHKESQGFWLSVNRIEPHKRVDVQVNAFKHLPGEKLVIVGSRGDDRKYNAVLEDLPKNVTYAGRIAEEELIDLYARCKGFITTAQDEDFGLTVVEALAAGKYVIAPAQGGYVEIIGKTKVGALIPNMRAQSLAQAIRSAVPQDPKACMARARVFDLSKFNSKMKEVIESIRVR